MFLSPTAAANIAKVSRSLISRALKDGTLQGTKKNNGHWAIDEPDLKRWMERNTKRSTKEEPKESKVEIMKVATRFPDDLARIKSLEGQLEDRNNKLMERSVQLAEVSTRLKAVEEVLDDVKKERNTWQSQAIILAESEASRTKARIGIFARFFGTK